MCTLNLIEMKTGYLIFVKMAFAAQKYEFISSTIALQTKNKTKKQQQPNIQNSTKTNKQTNNHKTSFTSRKLFSFWGHQLRVDQFRTSIFKHTLYFIIDKEAPKQTPKNTHTTKTRNKQTITHHPHNVSTNYFVNFYFAT